MNSVEMVKALCKEKGLPVSKLERDLGFANGYIGQLRKGTFPADRLRMIADYFGVTTDYLLGAETKKDPLAIQSEGVSGLTPEEINLILKYRAASEERKESARLLLRLE